MITQMSPQKNGSANSALSGRRPSLRLTVTPRVAHQHVRPLPDSQKLAAAGGGQQMSGMKIALRQQAGQIGTSALGPRGGM
jgi:hypothetical protein